MTNSRKRDAITECSGTYKRRDTGKGKETAGSDSDLDPIFDVPDMSTLANEFRYYNSRARALGEEMAGVKFLLERPIDEASFTNWGVKQLLRDRRLLGTVKLASKPQRLMFENTVVREFYANLETSAGDDDSAGYCKVYICGAMYDVSPTKLNKILGTRNLGRLSARLSNERLAKELTGGKLLVWPVIGLRRCHLMRMYAVLHEIGCSNWFPTNKSDDVLVDQAMVLYSVGRGLDFDLDEFIFRRILEEAERVPVILSFLILIFALLYEQGYRASKSADLNTVDPFPIKVTPELDLFRSIVENQLNVIHGEVFTFQAQVRSFIDTVAEQVPRQPNDAAPP